MRALALIAALLASPLAAQERMTVATCIATSDALAAAVGLPGPDAVPTVDAQGWCLIEGLRIADLPAQTYELDTLRWRGSDVQRFIEDGLPPRAIEIQGVGLRVFPSMDDPVFNYLWALQAADIVQEFNLVARWDGLQDAVIVDDASVIFNATNSFAVTARIDGVDLTDAATIQTSSGRAGLTALIVRSTFDGWFEGMLALPLGNALLKNDGTPPEQQVDALKDEAIRFLQDLPAETVPPQSVTSLAAFINALPRPRGVVRIDLSSDVPLGAARGMAVGLAAGNGSPEDAMAVALDGVNVLVSWTPKGSSQ